MIKNIKALIVAGGTGGHVLPGINLASFLTEKKYSGYYKKKCDNFKSTNIFQNKIQDK